MNRLILIGSFIVMALLGLGQNQFVLKGHIEAASPVKIHLSYLDYSDSVVSDNGVFRFTGMLPHPALFRFYVTEISSQKTTTTEFFVEKGWINLSSPFSTLNIAVPQMEFDQSNRIMNDHLQKFSSLVGLYRYTTDSLSKRKDLAERERKIGSQLAKKIIAFEEMYEKDFIIRNKQNYVGAYFLYRYGAGFMNDRETDSVLNLFELPVKKGYYITKLEEKLKYSSLLREGAKVPDLYLLNDKKTAVNLNTLLNNKLTLIDIWATWCKPCIETHAVLRELYTKYKTAGLEIIGISLDDNKDSWNKYIAREKLVWMNLIDPKGSKGEANKVFDLVNGNGVPFFALVNEKGEYVKVDMDEKELEAFIKEYLKP
ncbi:TlpA disulfide reductase family protein [Gynurincola endophyticus]|uniref:TlpA disulfide reductase family protein n=1 Tax=Gynurincola endophyticus TaxID=2479004 RepID=UPI000F8F3F49|nr:TlpA disulfide reductase family protein [Gynurincola endophyticus]